MCLYADRFVLQQLPISFSLRKQCFDLWRLFFWQARFCFCFWLIHFHPCTLSLLQIFTTPLITKISLSLLGSVSTFFWLSGSGVWYRKRAAKLVFPHVSQNKIKLIKIKYKLLKSLSVGSQTIGEKLAKLLTPAFTWPFA